MAKLSNITFEQISEIRNDQRKFNSLLNENKNFLRKITRFIKENNDMNEEDILQEAGIALWKAVEKYDPMKTIGHNPKAPLSRVKFSTYSHRVILNHFRRLYRDFARKNPIQFNFTDFAHSEIPIEEDLRTNDGLLIKDFSEKVVDKLNLEEEFGTVLDNYDCNILELRYGHCLNISEIADLLRTTEPKIRNYFYRVLQRKVTYLKQKFKISEEDLVRIHGEKYAR